MSGAGRRESSASAPPGRPAAKASALPSHKERARSWLASGVMRRGVRFIWALVVRSWWAVRVRMGLKVTVTSDCHRVASDAGIGFTRRREGAKGPRVAGALRLTGFFWGGAGRRTAIRRAGKCILSRFTPWTVSRARHVGFSSLSGRWVAVHLIRICRHGHRAIECNAAAVSGRLQTGGCTSSFPPALMNGPKLGHWRIRIRELHSFHVR